MTDRNAAGTGQHASWTMAAGLGVTQIIAWTSIYHAFALMIDTLADATWESIALGPPRSGHPNVLEASGSE